jgi:hypothetical protein
LWAGSSTNPAENFPAVIGGGFSGCLILNQASAVEIFFESGGPTTSPLPGLGYRSIVRAAWQEKLACLSAVDL